MSRFISWFSSKNGRRFTRYAVGFTGISIFGIHLALHGPLQENVKELFQIYSKGKAKPLSKTVKKLVNEVVRECKLKPEEKRKIRFFNVIGHEVFHSGGVNSPWGAMVGIPFYFEDAADINFSELCLEGHESIDWVIDGHDLLTALTLSENAKKFAIMREIYSCDIWSIMDNAVISSGCFLLAAGIITRINANRNALENVPLRNRLVIYALVYILSYLMYRCLQDPLKHITDKKCDSEAASIGKDYLEGGIEFYEKILLKNKTLRTLLGEKGKRKFDKDGNENYFIFAPKLPIRKRLEILQDLKKELQTVAV